MPDAATEAPRMIEIRNHSRNVLELETSVRVDDDGAPVSGKSKGRPFVLLLGGTDDGAAVRRHGRKGSKASNVLDSRTKVRADVFDKFKGDTVIAAMLDEGELEAIGA